MNINLDDIGANELLTYCPGNGEPMMAIDDEVNVGDLVKLNRWKSLSGKKCLGNVNPAIAQVVSEWVEFKIEIITTTGTPYNTFNGNLETSYVSKIWFLKLI